MNAQELLETARTLVASAERRWMKVIRPATNDLPGGIPQTEEALVLAAQQASQVQAGGVTTSIPQFTKPAV
jgi:hypothetical protein